MANNPRRENQFRLSIEASPVELFANIAIGATGAPTITRAKGIVRHYTQQRWQVHTVAAGSLCRHLGRAYNTTISIWCSCGSNQQRSII